MHIEKIVRNFDRYHKYSLGAELRDESRTILQTIISANNAVEERKRILLELRQHLEQLQVLIRLCHESGGFSSIRAYIYMSEQVQGIAKQNEGWLRSSSTQRKRRSPKSGKSAVGQNRLF